MKSLDWQTSLPRLPDVGRVQQVGDGQGLLAQEYLGRLGRAQEHRAPRVKESTGPDPVRDRERRRERRDQTRDQERGKGSQYPARLDVTV